MVWHARPSSCCTHASLVHCMPPAVHPQQHSQDWGTPQRAPTSRPRDASANASCAEKVDLPTPPLPDSTSTMCLIGASLAAMATRSGSGPLGADAQASWLGQPAQAAAVPAASLAVPGQSAQNGAA